MYTNRGNRFSNQPSGTPWRPVTIRPPVPTNPNFVNAFPNYESDSDSDRPRPYNVIFDSSSTSPAPSSSSPSPQETPEIQILGINDSPIANIEEIDDSTGIYLESINAETSGIEQDNQVTANTLEDHDDYRDDENENVHPNQDQVENDPLKQNIALLRQAVLQLEDDEWQFIQPHNDFTKF
ncbi:5236_t:CDS:2 [Scutellospora calospora]|uniref:5236_t:CDS:1 n=1 Tax=Scutellospora calospora TaxID=85575 RepID=A0ACA9JYU5_9GLOM|nr:5236_t:CDS:2 [Scutellospora calospora]